MTPVNEELSAFIAHLSLLTQSVVGVRHLCTEEINSLMELSLTGMFFSYTVFQDFLKINAHAHTVDTRYSFSPFPWCQEPGILTCTKIFVAYKIYYFCLRTAKANGTLTLVNHAPFQLV